MSEPPPYIPNSRPARAGNEAKYVEEVLAGAQWCGAGSFTARASTELEKLLGGGKALLTTSCTSALEMAALLADVGPGDEVIMPSFTFSSTANAIVLRGATPVFVDIKPDTLNLDEGQIEAGLSSRTKAISVVHYAGVGCEMDAIGAIAGRNNLIVIEDAAQALCADWGGRALGRFGALAGFSFHDSKNVIAGEGGALIVNDPALVRRAEIIWEKGTDRVRFGRGEIHKYSWVDVGGSFLPSELTAAVLLAQLERARTITEVRLMRWRKYHSSLSSLESAGLCLLPHPPAYSRHNGHIFYLLAPNEAERTRWLTELKAAGIGAAFHYVPLHSAPAGIRFARSVGTLQHTNAIAARLVRLPLDAQLEAADQDRIIAETDRIVRGR